MTQIRIDTELARQTGQRLLSEARALTDMAYTLNSQIDSLDVYTWDGTSRACAAPLLNQARPDCLAIAEQLENFGYLLVRVADTFEDRDQSAVKTSLFDWIQDWIGGIWPPKGFEWPFPWPPKWRWPFPFPPPWQNWHPLPWPPKWWPTLPVLPFLPILPPWIDVQPRPGIVPSEPSLPMPLPLPSEDVEPTPVSEPIPQPAPQPTPEPATSPPPPASSTLEPITEPVRQLQSTQDSRSCVWYARGRRPDLGVTGGGSAEDYISKYQGSVYQLNSEQINALLQSSSIRPGHAVVWSAGVQGAHTIHGHVAIVEEVHADYIVISEANWGGGGDQNTPNP